MTVVQLNLSGYQQAKLWIDEYPSVVVGGHIARTIEWSSTGSFSITPRKAAIEWMVPTGMGAMYGLLGAQIIPSSSDFEIEVQCVEANDVPYVDALVKSAGELVCSGLISEYGDAVMSGMTDVAKQEPKLPRAKVICDIGAHGRVGSCDEIFYALANAVLRTLLLPLCPSVSEVAGFLTIGTSNTREVARD